MLMRKATRPMIALWKRTWIQYGDRLRPGRKSGAELLGYLRSRYPLEERADGDLIRAVAASALERGERLGGPPEAVAFAVRDEGAGRALYEGQDAAFQGIPILADVELRSGAFHVEGSSRLWDELCAFRGLDEAEMGNYCRVAEYVSALRRFGLLEDALKG